MLVASPEAPAKTAVTRVEDLSHTYGERRALAGVSFDQHAGEIFGLLGPNGGGKTTLFKILCTAMAPQSGQAWIAGLDIRRQPDAVRRAIGVVFQSPSLDRKLTIRENLTHHGHLYGLSGRDLRERIAKRLEQFGLADRAKDTVETLSGGLARRADLARSLLHRPRVLLLDEPSTGLDPAARWDFWQALEAGRRQDGLSVLLTTHYMAEADRCDRVGIIDRGRLVALGTPEELKRSIPGESLTVEAEDAASLAHQIQQRLGVPATVVDGRVRIERPKAHEFVPSLVNAFPDTIRSVSLTKPTLEQVFIHRTGRAFEEATHAQ